MQTRLLKILCSLFIFSIISACGGGGGSSSGSSSSGGGSSSSWSSSGGSSLDSDNDGVIDSEDAFPNDPNESDDTDGDGTGDNSDPDIDGDDTPNEEDAFPFDPMEFSDLDGDGVGDNADFYANDKACAVETEGNGTYCYASWLTSRYVRGIEKVGDLLYFVDSSLNFFIIYDLQSKTFSALEIVSSEPVLSIAYLSAHNRLYIGFRSGEIAYLTPGSTTLVRDFASLDYSIYQLVAAGNYLWVKDSLDDHYIFDRFGNQTDHSSQNPSSESVAWNDSLSRMFSLGTLINPNDIFYESIDQSTGLITEVGDSPYDGEHFIYRPIRISKDDSKILLGSGDIYDASTLTIIESLNYSLFDAQWLEGNELILFLADTEGFILTRVSSGLQLLESRSYDGMPIASFPTADGLIFIYTDYDQYYVEHYVAVNEEI